VPDVVGMTAASADSTLRAAGFTVTQQSKVDNLCEGIGAVLNESPGRGRVGSGRLERDDHDRYPSHESLSLTVEWVTGLEPG
jgi:hypothetical protein